MARDYRRPVDEALIEAERELVHKELEIKRLVEQLQSAQDEINERTSDQALTLRKYRELQEQFEGLVKIIMNPHLDLDVAAADAQDYIKALNPASKAEEVES